MPVPHALYRHYGPPFTPDTDYVYRGAGISAPCEPENPQATRPAATGPTRLITGPKPPQLPYMAARLAPPLYRLFLPHPDRPYHGGAEPLLPRTCVHHHGNQPAQHTVQQQLGPPMRRCTPQPRTPQDIPAPARVPGCAGTPHSVARHRGICTTPGGQHKLTV